MLTNSCIKLFFCQFYEGVRVTLVGLLLALIFCNVATQNNIANASDLNPKSVMPPELAIFLDENFSYEPVKNHVFDFKCSMTQNNQNIQFELKVSDSIFEYYEPSIGGGLRLNKKTGKIDLINMKLRNKEEKKFFRSLEKNLINANRFSPLRQGHPIIIGEPIVTEQNMFGLNMETILRPYKFIKYRGMLTLKSNVTWQGAGELDFGNGKTTVKYQAKGIALHHLGTGLFVQGETQGTIVANGQKVNFTEKRDCEIIGQDVATDATRQMMEVAELHNPDKGFDENFDEYVATLTVLEKQLAALKAQQEQQQQTISSDKQKPVINIAGTAMNGPQGTIKGYVRDNTGIAEVRVDGNLVEVDSYGNFMANTYVPQSGINVSIEAVDLAGLTSSMSVRLDRLASSTDATITFDRLNPLGRNVASNKDALALIIGVNEYAKTPAKAHYADSDAQVFSDYAIQKLGIPANRVKTLVNNNADESGMLLATKRWLARAAKQGKTDVYIFFAGHGLASDDGSKMYLLPYDGAPELLDKTAILRDELFADISAANPRSVTVFLDTCYSGTTRGTDMLIASRPIAIRALEQSIPDNFTVMTAAAGDQTAKPLEEAKHGMFSYFLMKGMEGEADANNDNEITAGELHSYVQTNVIQQSSGSQTPELQGDADRVLVRFQ